MVPTCSNPHRETAKMSSDGFGGEPQDKQLLTFDSTDFNWIRLVGMFGVMC